MEYNYVLTTNGELYHWGVRGMKWGVRRYQNKDGSLTPFAKMRKKKQKADAAAKRKATMEAKKKAAEEAEKAKVKREKDIASGKISSKQMTNDELKAWTERLNLEDTYNTARGKQQNAIKTRGKKFVDKFLDSAIDKLAENVTADIAAQALKVIAVKGTNKLLESQGFAADVHTNNKKK